MGLFVCSRSSRAEAHLRGSDSFVELILFRLAIEFRRSLEVRRSGNGYCYGSNSVGVTLIWHIALALWHIAFGSLAHRLGALSREPGTCPFSEDNSPGPKTPVWACSPITTARAPRLENSECSFGGGTRYYQTLHQKCL